MNKKYFRFNSLIFALIFLPVFLIAQSEKGDRLYQQEKYEEALIQYKKAWEKNPGNANLAEQLANCYFELDEFSKAKEFYRKSYTQNSFNDNAKLAYVNTMIHAMEIDSAKLFIEDYLLSHPGNNRAKNLEKTINKIIKWRDEMRIEYKILVLENINSNFDDFAPTIFDNNLVFTSNRTQDLKDFYGVKSDKERNMNMYQARFANKEEIIFDSPTIMFPKLNTKNNQGPASFTDSTQFGRFVYFNSTGLKEKKSNKKQTMKIYRMVMKNNEWNAPDGISINSSDYSIHHPFITRGGDTLFFSSVRPGGYGGMDIYYSVIENGLCKTPVNLGPVINSKKNETFPTYYDGVLYFSSDGHYGFGKYDIFSVSDFNNPETIKNMGYPINSGSDDFGISFEELSFKTKNIITA